MIFSFRDASGYTEFPVAMTAGSSPNAALVDTEIVGGNTRTLDVQRSFSCQEAV